MDKSAGIDVVSPTGNGAADRELLGAVCDYLVREEATNTIQLSGFHARDSFPPEVAVLAARGGKEIVGVATLQVPFYLVLSHIAREEAIPALADEAARRNLTLPGVTGPSAAALAFAEAWHARTGQAYRPGMAQRILATSTVRHPPGVPGRWRLTGEADADFLLEWFAAFVVEADLGSKDDAATAAEALLKDHRPGTGNVLWLDADGQPVSLARYKAPTPHGVRIGPVYTPPEHRRRGYGSAVTAATTQLMLDRGVDFVCLYTDAANPTSNHVYEDIGYRLVADSMQYRFGSASDDEKEG